MNLLSFFFIPGCLFAPVPAITALVRRSPLATRVSAAVLSASMLAYILVVRGLWAAGAGAADSGLLIAALVPIGIAAVLAGYILSVVIGRDQIGEPLLQRPGFVALAGLGLLFLVYLRHPAFLTGFQRLPDGGEVRFGYLGKAFLSYLLVGIVLIGSNLESTFRVASAPVRRGFVITFITLFVLLGFATFVLASGLLYSFLPLSKLAALILPLCAGSVAIGHGFLRGQLVDARVPVSRAVVYSSFTAVAAGLYLLSIGLVAQVAEIFHWSPSAVVSLSLAFFAVLLAILLATSRRVQRRVRRFVDHNFYVKKHDFHARWNQVSQALDPGRGEAGIVDSVMELCQQIFYTRDVTLALRDPASPRIRPVRGQGADQPDLVLVPSDPLCRELKATRHSLVLDRDRDKYEFLAIYVEEEAWLSGTASEVITPLLVGDELLGVLGLKRAPGHGPFSSEDLDLLDNIACQAAQVLKGIYLAEEVGEARESQLLGQWSSVVLHDMKNQLLPLQGLARNLKTRMDDPAFLRAAVGDLVRLAEQTERIIERLKKVRQVPEPRRDRVRLDRLVQLAIDENPAARTPGVQVAVDLDHRSAVAGDSELLESVVRNIIGNALEALQGQGRLDIRMRRQSNGAEGDYIVLSIGDTGPGMTADFIHSRLFKPLATTKPHGTGLGLYQARNIVRAHGGEIWVESLPGAGSRFEIVLRASDADDSSAMPMGAAS